MSIAAPQTEDHACRERLEELRHRSSTRRVARRRPLRTFTRACSKFGVRCAIKGLAYRVAQRLCRLQVGHILVQSLDALPKTRSQVGGFEYRWLTADEVRTYAADRANDLEAAMAPLLENEQNFCFAAMDRSVLASYCWYALDSIPREHSLGVGLSFPTDTVYFYKAYTHPGYRGRGLHPAAMREAASFFAERGISRLVAIVEYANWPSLRSHAKLGFRLAGRFLKVGRRPLVFERYPKLAGTCGISFGDVPQLPSTTV